MPESDETPTKLRRKPRKCPECGSTRVQRIVYGMPGGPPPDDADYILGGCMIGEDSPRFGCADCGWRPRGYVGEW